MLSNFYIEEHVKHALQEDIGFGDVTTESIMAEDKIFEAKLTSRTEGIICGLEVFRTVFKILSDKVEVKLYFKDGDRIKKGDIMPLTKKQRKELLNYVLEDDSTPYGGVSHQGETLKEFLDEVGLIHDLCIEDINLALKSCGIKQINNIWG